MLLEMRNISKSFGPVRANDGIDFAVDQGEIVGLLGENGAGKTTLMNILYGMCPPDEGRISVNGRRIHLRSPREAMRQRIGMVHQHFMLVPSFTVLENVVLGTSGDRLLGRSTADAEKVSALAREHGLTMELDAMVGKLAVGQRQQVEILKMLYRGAQILIFDEPTAVLTPQESEILFTSMRAIAAAGRAIIFITHKLDEVFAVSTRLVVLRRGKVVLQSATESTDKGRVTRAMVAQEITAARNTAASRQDQVVLELNNVSAANDQGLPALTAVSMRIHSGEILGIAGVSGNGQTELAEVITKLRPLTGGSISLHGESTAGKRASWIKESIAHVPESRLDAGIASAMTVGENLALKCYGQCCLIPGLLDRREISTRGRNLVSQFNIATPTVNARAGNLSGGNLQRVILARELTTNAKLIVAAYPTRGLDIASAEFVRQLLLAQREAGTAILLISESLEELFSLSDRVAVLYRGKLTDAGRAAELDLHGVGQMMMGQAPLRPAAAQRSEAAHG